jgi:soluble lytic murein transglycosylase-like protein
VRARPTVLALAALLIAAAAPVGPARAGSWGPVTDVGWVARPPHARHATEGEGDVTIEGVYLDEIREAARRYGVPQALVFSIIRFESDFNPYAISAKGARGLMQLMPDTARILGVRDVFDPLDNIDGGVRHLRGLLDRYGNDLALAVAAYNAGERAVATYAGIPPFPETRQYVRRVLRLFDELTRDRIFEDLPGPDVRGVALVQDSAGRDPGRDGAAESDPTDDERN